MKQKHNKSKKLLFFTLLMLSVLLSLNGCSNDKTNDTFIDTKQYLGTDFYEFESMLNENKTAVFLGYNGIIKATQEDGKVDLIAFESTEIEVLSLNEIEAMLNSKYGSAVYVDNDETLGLYHYYEIGNNYTYLISQYDLNKNFVRFIITKFNDSIIPTTTEQKVNLINSEYSALAEAENYVENNPWDIINKSYGDYGINDIKLFEVGSSELERESTDYYTVIVKGNFSGYDDYGNWFGSFVYETRLLVYKEDGDIRINSATLTKKY